MRIIVLILAVFLTGPVFAEETLFDGHIEHSGGFGGPVVRFTKIGPHSDMGVMVGGRGGWIINHSFIIGGGGYGLTSEHDPSAWEENYEDYRMNIGYGGLFFGYTRHSDKLFHYSIETMIGWGGVDYSKFEDDDQYENNGDSFVVLEPGVNLEMNVTRFFRICVGATYRYIQGVNYHRITDEDLSGLTGQLVFRFGSF